MTLPVLIIDDDAEQRSLVRTMFERAGLGPVSDAVDAQDALAQATGGDFRLILLDLEMPGRSGIEVLPDLRQACPGASVVILSNLPRRTYGDAAIAAGAVGYVEKRVPIHQLVSETMAAASLSEAVAAHLSADLEASATSPARARDLIRSFLSAEDQELVDLAALLITELVTNAVVHAAAAPRVEVSIRGDAVRVAVQDDDPTMPREREPDLGRPGGRGILLLDRLSSRWGAEPTADGKVVWFELPRQPRA